MILSRQFEAFLKAVQASKMVFWKLSISTDWIEWWYLISKCPHFDTSYQWKTPYLWHARFFTYCSGNQTKFCIFWQSFRSKKTSFCVGVLRWRYFIIINRWRSSTKSLVQNFRTFRPLFEKLVVTLLPSTVTVVTQHSCTVGTVTELCYKKFLHKARKWYFSDSSVFVFSIDKELFLLTLRRPLRIKLRMSWFFDVSKV